MSSPSDSDNPPPSGDENPTPPRAIETGAPTREGSAAADIGVKVAALIAYEADELSLEGRRRVETRLLPSEANRRGLASIRLYNALAEDAREASELGAEEVDWSRMELALAREAKLQAEANANAASEDEASDEGPKKTSAKPGLKRAGSGRAGSGRPSAGEGSEASPGWHRWAFVAAAAALLLLTFYAWKNRPSEAPLAGGELRQDPSRRIGSERPDETEERAAGLDGAHGELLSAEIVLVGGTAQRRRGYAATEAEIGTSLAEGDRLITAGGSEAQVYLAPGTGFALHAQSEVALGRLRERSVELRLVQERFSHVVAPVHSDSSYAVLAAGYRIEVRGTRFMVDLRGSLLTVEVEEGWVVIEGPDGSRRMLRAVGRWSSGERVELEVDEEHPLEVQAPRALETAALEWPVLRITSPIAESWTIGDANARARGSIALRAPEGSIHIAARDALGHLREANVELGSDGLDLDGALLEAEAPRVHTGHLPAEVIAHVVRRSGRNLQRCYERNMRQGQWVSGRLRAQMTVDLQGEPQRVRLVGEAPAALHDCIIGVISRWSFPPPAGGPVPIEVPLRFSLRRP